MSELPKGWVWAELGDTLLELRNGIATKPEHNSGLPILRISAVRPRQLDLSDVRFLPETASGLNAYDLLENDLLFTRYNGNRDLVGACARVGAIDRRTVYPDKLIRARVDGRLTEAAFIEFASNFGVSRAFIESKGKSAAGQVGISGSDLRLAPIPIAPLAEQRRIVAKLDDLLARSRRAKEELAAIPALLERYRQSVLAAAFRGDLTADWRAKNPDLEPASELLKRIRLERRRRWEEAELARLTAKGKAPTDEKWKGKYEEPSAIETDGLLPLPEGWCWAGLSELATLQLGQRRAPEFAEEASFPYVRAGNITWRGLDLSDVKHMGFLHPEPLFLRPGDVLLNEASGSPAEVGKPALWRGEVPKCCFQATVLRVRPASTSIVGEWLYLALLGEARAGKFAAMAPGMGMVHLSAERMRNWPIPLAPMEEQMALSTLVQQALDWSYRLQDELGTLNSGADALDRTILTRAFRGELVPQDPNDEPASVLLERIRAERAAAPPKRPGRKPRSPNP